MFKKMEKKKKRKKKKENEDKEGLFWQRGCLPNNTLILFQQKSFLFLLAAEWTLSNLKMRRIFPKQVIFLLCFTEHTVLMQSAVKIAHSQLKWNTVN